LVAQAEKQILLGLSPSLQFDEATSLEAAIDHIKRTGHPDLVLLDLNLPDAEATAAIRQVQEHLPSGRIVAFTGETAPHVIRLARGLGIHGYIPKNLPRDQVNAALRAVLTGRSWFPPDHEANAPTHCGLNDAEVEVLACLAAGRKTKEIVRRLGLSERTVTRRLYDAFEKLGVKTRGEAISLVQQLGIGMVNGRSKRR
jgi:DNA-binding NarL/FixJ family response regulator